MRIDAVVSVSHLRRTSAPFRSSAVSVPTSSYLGCLVNAGLACVGRKSPVDAEANPAAQWAKRHKQHEATVKHT